MNHVARNHCIRRRRLLVVLERPRDDDGHGVIQNAFAENLSRRKNIVKERLSSDRHENKMHRSYSYILLRFIN